MCGEVVPLSYFGSGITKGEGIQNENELPDCPEDWSTECALESVGICKQPGQIIGGKFLCSQPGDGQTCQDTSKQQHCRIVTTTTTTITTRTTTTTTTTLHKDFDDCNYNQYKGPWENKNPHLTKIQKFMDTNRYSLCIYVHKEKDCYAFAFKDIKDRAGNNEDRCRLFKTNRRF